jgi:hypothetical protein
MSPIRIGLQVLNNNNSDSESFKDQLLNLDIDENIEGINRRDTLQNTHHKQLATEEKLQRLHENRRKSTL